MRPSEAEEAGPKKTKGTETGERGQRRVLRRTGDVSSHTVTERPANKDSGTERTLMPTHRDVRAPTRPRGPGRL